MLAALVLAGIIAAPIGTIALLIHSARPARSTGAWPTTRRFASAIIGTVVLGALVAVAMRLLGVSEHNTIAGVAGLIVGSLIWLPVTRRWNARAHLCWATSIFLFAVYLVYILEWTFYSHLDPASEAGGVLLWLFELFAAILASAYLWEICDAIGSETWNRRIEPVATAMLPALGELPFVSLHVPAHNEPPDMVIDTLRSLVRLDYPRYEIILIDDNTDDESLWRPVAAGRGLVPPAQREVRAPGRLAGLQVRGAELRAHSDDRRASRDHRRGRLRLPARPRLPQALRAAAHRELARVHPGAAGLPRLGARPVLPAAVLLLQVLLRGVPAVAERARRSDLRGHDGADPAGRARAARRLGRVVHHGGRRAVAAAAAGPLGRAATRPVLRQRHHAADVRGAQGPALPVVLRRHPDPADALALLDAGPAVQGEPAHRRPALGVSVRRRAVVRRPARPGVPGLPAGRGSQPGHRRRRAVPQAHPVPCRHGPGAGAARPGARGRPAAPRHRRVVAGRARRVLHLAVHLPGGGAGLDTWPVRQEGRVPAHAQDQRKSPGVGGVPGELGRVDPGAARLSRHRGRADQGHRAGRAAAGRPAAVPDPRHGGSAARTMGRAAGGAAAGPGRGPHDGVEAQPAPPDVRPQCGARRAGHGLRRGDRRAVSAAAGPHPRADPEPGRADHEADRVADAEPDTVAHA